MRPMLMFWGLGVAAWMWLVPLPAFAVELSETGQPQSYAFSLAPADIRGLGDVTFGMSVEEVKAVVSKIFPDAAIENTFDLVQETDILRLSVPDLAPIADGPSPGPGDLAFVFGASSKRLMAINMVWSVQDDVTSAQRNAILETGTAYVAHLLGYFWAPFATSRGVVIGPNSVILFTGRDSQRRGVEVVVDGVPLDVERPGGSIEHRPIEAGPASLRIRLSAQPDDPDVFTIPPGSF